MFHIFDTWRQCAPHLLSDPVIGIIKTHDLRFQESEALQAVFASHLCPNVLKAPARLAFCYQVTTSFFYYLLNTNAHSCVEEDHVMQTESQKSIWRHLRPGRHIKMRDPVMVCICCAVCLCRLLCDMVMHFPVSQEEITLSASPLKVSLRNYHEREAGELVLHCDLAGAQEWQTL